MSEVFNIFDIDNLVLEFSNSDLNASLVTTDYNTEKGDVVGIARVGSARTVLRSKKIKNGLVVKGNTTDYRDLINLTWYTKDLFNHGYCRYTTQKSLAGTILKFKIERLENVIPYTDVFNEQYLTIIDNKDKEYKIELGKLGNKVSFDSEYEVEEEIKNGDILPLEDRWIIKDKTLTVKYFDSEDELKELLVDIDFEIDYKKGLITFLKDNIVPVGTKLRVRGFKNSDEEYIINFSTLRDINNEVVLVDNVKCVMLPINVESSIGYGNTFVYRLINIEVTRGGQSWLQPTRLKKHEVELCENYTYTRNLNPRRLIYNIEKMGYKEKLILHLGEGEFFNIPYKNDNTLPILNTGFIEWYKDLLKYSKDRGFNEIQIVIPMYNKYLMLYCQRTLMGGSIKVFNPILREVIDYVKTLMTTLMDMTKDMSISFLIDKLYWGMDNEGNLGLYNYDTVISYQNETGKDYLGGSGNVEEYELTSEILDLASWFSNKLLEVIIELSAITEINILTDSSIINSNNLYYELNNCFNKHLNYTNKVYISNSVWDDTTMDIDSLITKVIQTFDVSNTESITICITGIDEYYATRRNTQDKWDIVTKYIEKAKFEKGLNILIISGASVRGNSYFLFNPLAYVELTTLDTEHRVALCKVNKEIISHLLDATVTSITRKVDDIDEIEVRVPYYIQDRFTHKRMKNPYYDEVKTERLIRLNEREFFVIKEINEGIEETTNRVVKAYSLEHKLSKRPVLYSKGQSLQLYSDDLSQPDGILNDLERETGWKVGYINEECRFELVDGVLKTKYRYFEEINTTWYSFLMEEISELFNCLFQFNTYNKTVNVYPNTVLGADSGLYLTEDNYIKSIERVDSTNDIVTRLTLLGRDEVNIYEVNPLGTDYIENFDYFIENGEMSDELVEALKLYYSILDEKFKIWTTKNEEYLEKKNLQSIYESDLKILQAQIDNLIKIKEEYDKNEDTENSEKAQEQLDKFNEEKEVLENFLKELNIKVPALREELDNLSINMNRESITVLDGELLFTDELLNELQEFIYHDTITDDSYMEAKPLMESGERILKDLSRPTSEYKIDIVNFLERVGTKRAWSGDLHLRDVITLKSEKHSKEVELFIVGFTYNPKDKTIDIELSNKITTKNSTKTIAEILKISKETSKLVNLNKYLWASQKEEIENTRLRKEKRYASSTNTDNN